MAIAYLAADCQLLSSEEGRRQLCSADSRTSGIRWTYTQQLWGPMLHGFQPKAMNSLSGC